MLNRGIIRTRIDRMPQKGDRSKRRRPRKGFPHPVTGYLDDSTYELVSKAAERAGESISTFVARAVQERSEEVLKTKLQSK